MLLVTRTRVLTINFGKSARGNKGIEVDALKDVLVQLLGLWAVKSHS